MRAPDYVAPLQGWRLWHVVERDGELRLVSPLYRVQWPARRELVAACRRGLEPGLSLYPPRTRHAAPSPGCGCGIYGSCGPVQVAAYMSRFFKQREDVVHRVIGTVSLWGEVVECDSGWRASYAYPRRLYVPLPQGRRFALRGLRPSGHPGRRDRARTRRLRRARGPRRMRIDRRAGRDHVSAGTRQASGVAAFSGR